MMKKALLSLLLVAVVMPLAMAQDNSSLEIVNNNVTACETYTWNVNGVTYTSSTVTTYLNATNDNLFYYCRSYIIDKYDTFCLNKFVPPFDTVHFNQICYECDSVRKSKYSPNDTFVTLFRICYEHRNKLMNEKIPVMINQKLCWVKRPLN